jgi:hypothetical protein
MKRLFNPLDYWRAALTTGQMMAEAQSVIAMRTMGMAGHWNVTKGENARMVAEKGEAMREAGLAAAGAIMRGASPMGVAMATIKPVKRRTGANARRLAKRGLR